MSNEYSAVRSVISIEDRIKHLRSRGSSLVDTLDQRVEKQRQLVKDILAHKNWKIESILSIKPEDLPDDELRLCRQIWLDCDYIDSLR